jgi:hypothetical protein
MTKRHYAPGYHVEWKRFSKDISAPSNKKEETAQTSLKEATTPILNLMNQQDVAAVTASLKEEADVMNVMPAPIQNAKRGHKKSLKIANEIAQVIKSFSDQSYEANVHTTKGPDALSWLVWVAAIIVIPVFGGPLFILIWTSKNNGQPDWKPVFLSLLCYCLCWLPGLIFDIIWIKKNCEGSLF